MPQLTPSDEWNEGLVPSVLAGELFLINFCSCLIMMIIEREKEIEKKGKKAIIQTEEKFGAQSSNAKSERQREFEIIIIPKVRTWVLYSAYTTLEINFKIVRLAEIHV